MGKDHYFTNRGAGKIVNEMCAVHYSISDEHREYKRKVYTLSSEQGLNSKQQVRLVAFTWTTEVTSNIERYLLQWASQATYEAMVTEENKTYWVM